MTEGRKLKVGFVGPGGTGKTSVANLLANDKEVKEQFRPSVVRSVYKRMDVPNETTQLEMTSLQLWALQREILAEKCVQDAQYPNGIFDRTPVDHMAYCLYRCGSHIKDEEYEEVENVVQLYTRRYDLLFFFPLYDWKIKNDGFRQDNKAYRVASQTLMLGLLNMFELPYIYVEDKPVEERITFIKKMMQYKKNEIQRRTEERI